MKVWSKWTPALLFCLFYIQVDRIVLIERLCSQLSMKNQCWFFNLFNLHQQWLNWVRWWRMTDRWWFFINFTLNVQCLHFIRWCSPLVVSSLKTRFQCKVDWNLSEHILFTKVILWLCNRNKVEDFSVWDASSFQISCHASIWPRVIWEISHERWAHY